METANNADQVMSVPCAPHASLPLRGKKWMKRHTAIRLAALILGASLVVSGWIIWAGLGPIPGEMRKVETEELRILQRAEGRLYAPKYWEDYKITRRDLTEPTWVRSRDEGFRPPPEVRSETPNS